MLAKLLVTLILAGALGLAAGRATAPTAAPLEARVANLEAKVAALQKLRPSETHAGAFVFQDTDRKCKTSWNPPWLAVFEDSSGNQTAAIDCDGNVYVLGAPTNPTAIMYQLGGAAGCCYDPPHDSGYTWTVGDDGQGNSGYAGIAVDQIHSLSGPGWSVTCNTVLVWYVATSWPNERPYLCIDRAGNLAVRGALYQHGQ